MYYRNENGYSHVFVPTDIGHDVEYYMLQAKRVGNNWTDDCLGARLSRHQSWSHEYCSLIKSWVYKLRYDYNGLGHLI